ncbi:MAG: rod shape-determining protein MreC [Bacteroidota bacterium]
MRNLLLFLIKHNYIIFFLLLESFSIYLVVQNNYYHKNVAVSSANSFAGSIYGAVDEITEYFSLKQVNKTLAEENAMLRAKIIDSVMINDTVKVRVSDSIFKQRYEYITAKVISNTTKKQKNYITLNKGRKDGVTPNMAVISSSGIVGVVKNVSENFCSIVSFLNNEIEISAKIKKTGHAGTLQWSGKGSREAILRDISTYVKINKGDSIITSGYSSEFPEGILVGIISDFEINAGENFYTIDVELTSDFSNLSYVYIVRNLYKEEQETLESKLPNEN